MNSSRRSNDCEGECVSSALTVDGSTILTASKSFNNVTLSPAEVLYVLDVLRMTLHHSIRTKHNDLPELVDQAMDFLEGKLVGN